MTGELREYLEERLAAARAAGERWRVSPDGTAVMLYSHLFCASYFSPDGDVIFEEYDVAADAVVYYREGRERVVAITVAMRKHPLLAELLPGRTEEATDCAACGGQGFRDFQTQKAYLLCWECGGLGWTAPGVFGDSGNGFR